LFLDNERALWQSTRTDRQAAGGLQGPEDLIGEQGLLKQLTKALVEWAMQAEPTGSYTNSEVIIVRAKRVMMREHFRSPLSGRLYDFCTIRAKALEVIDSRRVKMVDLVGIGLTWGIDNT
jgi:hypothetical protein